MPRLSVIMLSYNDYPNVNRRLAQFVQMIDNHSEVIWVDNASTEPEFVGGTKFWVNAYQKLNKRLSVYRMKSNVGFQAANNYAVEKASGDLVLITQPDVLFHDLNFINALRNSPLEDDMILGGRLISFDGGWNKLRGADGKDYVIPYLEGFLLFMYKKAFLDIGGFDPIYYPADMEDIDFSLKALQKGYKLAEISTKDFKHLGGQSFIASNLADSRRQTTEKNKIKFDEKWREEVVKIFGG